MNTLSERKTDIINLLNSKNGPIIAGIVGIVCLVGLDDIINNNYCVSYNKSEGFSFGPFCRNQKELSEDVIDEKIE